MQLQEGLQEVGTNIRVEPVQERAEPIKLETMGPRHSGHKTVKPDRLGYQ